MQIVDALWLNGMEAQTLVRLQFLYTRMWVVFTQNASISDNFLNALFSSSYKYSKQTNIINTQLPNKRLSLSSLFSGKQLQNTSTQRKK